MARPAEAPSGERAGGERYRVDRVTTLEDLGAACRLAADAFGLPLDSVARVLDPGKLATPDVDIFLTRRSGQPVSTVLTTGAGEVIGIWNRGTPPAFQRQGAGRATLEAAMAYHRGRGARLFYLGATPAGKPLYDRAGFRTVEETPIWVAGRSAQFPGP